MTWFDSPDAAARALDSAGYLADTASNLQPIELSVDEWNRRVDAFDVEALATQLAAARVPYLILTLGQNSGYYLSLNTPPVRPPPPHDRPQRLLTPKAKPLRLTARAPAVTAPLPDPAGHHKRTRRASPDRTSVLPKSSARPI